MEINEKSILSPQTTTSHDIIWVLGKLGLALQQSLNLVTLSEQGSFIFLIFLNLYHSEISEDDRPLFCDVQNDISLGSQRTSSAKA